MKTVIRVLIVVGILIALGLLLGVRLDQSYKQAYERGYLDACKDVYRGNLQYELISNEDGTREWKKK